MIQNKEEWVNFLHACSLRLIIDLAIALKALELNACNTWANFKSRVDCRWIYHKSQPICIGCLGNFSDETGTYQTSPADI